MTYRTCLLSALIITTVAASPLSAQTIVQTVSSARYTDWNDAIWDSPAAVPSSGNDYQTASGLLLRTPETGGGPASTFAGDSLEVVEGSALVLKNLDTTSTLSAAFTLSGGHLYHGPSGSGGAVLAVGSFTTSGDSDIAVSRGDLTIGAPLTGSGDLHVGDSEASGFYTVGFSGISSFTGTITIGDAGANTFAGWEGFSNDVTLDLGTTSYIFQDTVTILGNSVLQVNTGQTLTFSQGDLVDPVNATVAVGTYSTADLGANYAGGGTIVVVSSGPDTTPPGINSLSPSDDATGVPIRANLAANFNEPVMAGAAGSINLWKDGDTPTLVESFDVTNPAEVGFIGSQITIDPTADLDNETSYYIEIDANAIKDGSDNFHAGLSGNDAWNFTTAASPPVVPWEAATRATLEAMALNLEQTLLPWSVPAAIFEVETYGAVGDGVTLNTVAIQAAIDACSASGGGVVLFGQGDYVTGTIDLKSGVMLEIEGDSRILGSLDLADYPDRRATRQTVMDTLMEIRHSLIFAEGVERVGIRGPGTIDYRGTHENFPGIGGPSWGTLPGRPFGMRFIDSSQIVLQNINLKDSPSWNQSYLNCEDLIFENVSVVNQSNHNQDGLDLDGCRRIIVRGCVFNVRDDGICLKGQSLLPLEDLLIENCTVYSKTNPLKIGTDTQGSFRRILARNLTLGDTPSGMPDLVPSKTANSGITLATVDGADVVDILITNVTINEVDCPIFISVHDRGRVMPGMPAPPVGNFRRVIIENVTGTGNGRQGSFISGIDGSFAKDVVIRNVDLSMSGGVGTQPTYVRETPNSTYPDADLYEDPLPAYGFYVRHARNIHFENVEVTPVSSDARPLFYNGGDTAGLYLDVPPVPRETIAQSVNGASGTDWNDALWGAPAATPTAADDYQMSAGLGSPTVLRTPASGSSTFGGGSLEVVDDTVLLLKNIDATSTISGIFTLSGGTLSASPDGAGNHSATLAFDRFTVSGDCDIQLGDNAGNLIIGTDLSGSGHLHLANAQASQASDTVSFEGISSFSGAITLGGSSAGAWQSHSGGLTLDLGTANFTFQDQLTILGDSILQVNSGRTLSFGLGDLVDPVNGTVAAGTYSTADLGANYTGGGTITVGPDTAPPVISSTTPADGALNVSTESELVITFDEDVNLKPGGTITITDTDDGSGTQVMSLLDSARARIVNHQLTLYSSVSLEPDTNYEIVIDTNTVKDLSATPNVYPGTAAGEWNFSTVAVATDTTAYWQLDEASGDLVDVIGGHNLSGGVGATYALAALVDPVPNPDAAAGSANPASIDFSGLTSAWESQGADNPFELLGTSSFTFEGWLQHNIADGTQSGIETIAGDRQASGNFTGWTLWVDDGILLFYYDMGTPRAFVQSTTRVDDGTPHHFAVVWDHTGDANRRMSIYIDGVLEDDTNHGDPITSFDLSDAPFALGARSDGSTDFNGRLDELRFSSAVLTPSEFLNVPPPSGAVIVIR